LDIVAIDRRLEMLRGEMAALVKLNLTTGIDAEIYGEEYTRITSEIEDLRNKRLGVAFNIAI